MEYSSFRSVALKTNETTRRISNFLTYEQSLREKPCMSNADDKYYICSKRVKFLKSDILKLVTQLFENNNTKNIHISKIYVFLQRELKIFSVNMQNLKDFLMANSSGFVSYDDVRRISKLYFAENSLKSRLRFKN